MKVFQVILALILLEQFVLRTFYSLLFAAKVKCYKENIHYFLFGHTIKQCHYVDYKLSCLILVALEAKNESLSLTKRVWLKKIIDLI